MTIDRGPVGRERPRGGRIGLTSLGLWRNRSDLEALTEASAVLALPGLGDRWDTALGWGARPSGHRAKNLASYARKPFILVEDGLLKGYAPGLREPPHSYVLDRTGIYFDTARPSDFSLLLEGPAPAFADAEWARARIEIIRTERLTKFNAWPDIATRAAGLPWERSYVLVVDQVAHDASIAGAGATRETFERMLRHAADEADGRTLVVRTHPSARRESLLLAAAHRLRIPVCVPAPINPWRLVEAADSVHTISSQIGFEALMAGRPVVCHGRSFYAGRGLTDDRFDLPAFEPVSIEQIFLAFHIRYAVYIDLHRRTRITLDTALDQALSVRAQRARLPAQVHTMGLSPWKRQAVTPFLIGRGGAPKHHPGIFVPFPGKSRSDEFAVWGPAGNGAARLRMEDGFLRSVGLGVDLVMPSSLTLDRSGVHYERARASDLEIILQTSTFPADLVARAERLRQAIVSSGVTKYNTGGAFKAPPVSPERLRLLVPGQVEADRSITHGSPFITTNADLVAACRELFPDAFIVFRPHPDVSSGRRAGGVDPRGHDMVANGGSIHDWIIWAQRIETMTSLTGFEALLRDRAVGVHGTPFYAGWGLTDDRLAAPNRRTRRLTIEELVAGALLLYPFYIHPVSRLPCRPEDLVETLSASYSGTPLPGQASGIKRAINRMAVRWRDALRRQ